MAVVGNGLNTRRERAWRRITVLTVVAAFFLGAPATGWPAQTTVPVDRLPHLLIALPESHERPAHAIVVEKSTQTLSVYRYNGSYEKIAEYPCSTGKNRGDKQISGDMKTPEGVYFFTTEYLDHELGPLYGSRAFPMDYPNIADRQEGKGGYAIWMHGTNRPLVPRDSNGCVALRNDTIDEVRRYVQLDRTPILIADRVEYVDMTTTGQIRDRLSSFLEGWRRSLGEGSYHQYLAHYDAGYLPPIQWWPDWQALREPAKESRRSLQVEVTDLAIYRHRELLVAAFAQVISVDDRQIQAGNRKLFIADTENGYRIVGDAYLPENGPEKLSEDKNPLLTAASRYRSVTEPEQMIQPFLDTWLKAWSAKDIQAYGACYAAEFRSQGKNRKQWLAYKNELNRRYEYISVSAADISHRRSGDAAIVRFRQIYESNTFKAKGIKTLHLRMEAGQWKITREIYSGK